MENERLLSEEAFSAMNICSGEDSSWSRAELSRYTGMDSLIMGDRTMHSFDQIFNSLKVLPAASAA